MEVDVSLDNVTFVGRWRDWDYVRECLEWARLAGGDESVRSLPAIGRTAGMRHREAWVVDGAHFSCLVELSALGHRFVPVSEDGLCSGRVELNPNKATARVLELVRMLEVSHVTRADVALDYEGVDVNDYCFMRERVKTQTFQGCGGVESLYLGSVRSDRFVRVYDKSLELGVPDVTMTRVEGVGRKGYALSAGLFEGVRAYSRAISPGLTPSEAGRIALAVHYPEYVATLHKHTRRSYRELVAEHQGELSPSPAEVYTEHRKRLGDMIERLQEGEAVEVAKVYRLAAREGPGQDSGSASVQTCGACSTEATLSII